MGESVELRLQERCLRAEARATCVASANLNGKPRWRGRRPSAGLASCGLNAGNGEDVVESSRQTLESQHK